jgi:hypothetical protein
MRSPHSELGADHAVHMVLHQAHCSGVRTGFMIGERALIDALAKWRRTPISLGAARGITFEWCREDCFPRSAPERLRHASRACLAVSTCVPDAVATRPGGFRLVDAPGRSVLDCDASTGSREGSTLTGWPSSLKEVASGSSGCRFVRSRRRRSTRESGVWRRASRPRTKESEVSLSQSSNETKGSGSYPDAKRAAPEGCPFWCLAQ